MIRSDLRALMARTGWDEETLLRLALDWMCAQKTEDAFVAHVTGLADEEERYAAEGVAAEDEEEDDEMEDNLYVLCTTCGTSLHINDARVRLGTPGWSCPECLTEKA